MSAAMPFGDRIAHPCAQLAVYAIRDGGPTAQDRIYGPHVGFVHGDIFPGGLSSYRTFVGLDRFARRLPKGGLNSHGRGPLVRSQYLATIDFLAGFFA
jgi:hypothetical protein